jgi:hypothetical protein
VIDVTYARQLVHNRHILWASENVNQPDLGQGSGVDQDLWNVWSEALKEPVLSQPGIYRTFSIELDVFGLAVCAIMSSTELDVEGVTTASVNISADTIDKNISKQNANGNSTSTDVATTAVVFSESSCSRAFK